MTTSAQTAAAPAGRIRTLFVSDVHLGCRHSHAEAFYDFLRQHHPDAIYLVGDIIDGWKLKRNFQWTPLMNDILSRLHRMTLHGTRIFYTPGNHDAFLRKLPWNFRFVEVKDHFVFAAKDGRRFLVTHGDLYDRVECGARWLSQIASIGYDALLSANWLLGRAGGCTATGRYSFAGRVKRCVKQAVRYISDFERTLARQAQRFDCQGVICGHIHTPTMCEIDGVAYFNSGDWVENCSALAEYEDGRWGLISYYSQPVVAGESSESRLLDADLAPAESDWPGSPRWNDRAEALGQAGS